MEVNAPKALTEALDRLAKEIGQDELIRFKTQGVPPTWHFSGGMAMRNAWGLWTKDAPLVKYFKRFGIWHADDMSGIIMTCLVRRLKGEPLLVKDQVRAIKAYWAKEKKAHENRTAVSRTSLVNAIR